MRRVARQSREQKSDLEVERAYRPPTGKISYEEVLYLVHTKYSSTCGSDR
jgi:hypothetical protein